MATGAEVARRGGGGLMRGGQGRAAGPQRVQPTASAASPRHGQGLRPGSQSRGAAAGGVAVPADRQIRLRGLDERVRRHRGLRGVAPVQPGDGADVPRRPQVIASTVASDPEKYNEASLGKPNEAYCAWILDPKKWGGMQPADRRLRTKDSVVGGFDWKPMFGFG